MKRFVNFILLLLFSITTVYSQQDELIFKYRGMAVDYQQKVKMAEHKLAGSESMVEAAKSDFLPRLNFSTNPNRAAFFTQNH